MNNTKTIIENVEYFDMLDAKKSWYIDAIRFDPSFPLVRTYRSDAGFTPNLDFWYLYWDSVFAYYGSIGDAAAICMSFDVPNPMLLNKLGEEEGESFWSNGGVWVNNINDLKPFQFLFRTQEYINGKFTVHLLLGTRFSVDVNYLKARLYEPIVLLSEASEYYPHTQLTISSDWDLIKRYFFFTIKNHQYYLPERKYCSRGHSYRYYLKDKIKDKAMNWVEFPEESSVRELPFDYKYRLREYEKVEGREGIDPEKLFEYNEDRRH